MQTVEVTRAAGGAGRKRGSRPLSLREPLQIPRPQQVALEGVVERKILWGEVFLNVITVLLFIRSI